MKRLWTILIGIILLGSLAMVQAAGHPSDNEGAKDPPLFNRMAGYFIYICEENDFNQYEFPTAKNKTQPVEGHYYHVAYQMPFGEKSSSPLAILRNYENAVKAMGGQVVFTTSTSETVLKLTKNGIESWVHVKIISGDGSAYEVYLVQKSGMAQEIVVSAESMAQSLKDTGKVALYGIYFDTGKVEVKPESEAALGEIAKLLQTDPKLKLYVVGHTDNTGDFEANLKLSRERAEAALKVLVEKYKIAATRLKAFGCGPLAPLASNRTEEGRALNRRVELVAQ